MEARLQRAHIFQAKTRTRDESISCMTPNSTHFCRAVPSGPGFRADQQRRERCQIEGSFFWLLFFNPQNKLTMPDIHPQNPKALIVVSITLSSNIRRIQTSNQRIPASTSSTPIKNSSKIGYFSHFSFHSTHNPSSQK